MKIVRSLLSTIYTLLILAYLNSTTLACTNLIVTAGASFDNTTMVAYNADSGNLIGYLYHYQASKNNLNMNRKVYDWDSGKYLGIIPEAEITYNVVGNTNEYGLTIAETTFGGIDVGVQDGAVLDYGSLIYITLQRSKTVREAINTMSTLMQDYGYASEGESFSLAGPTEVWIMEVIGKGSHGKGAVWVAKKIPNGMIAAHSNQARITTFPRDTPQESLYSSDVVDFAKHILKVYKSAEDDPHDLRFSFSDVYNPVSFMSARASEARTWALFSMLGDDPKFMETYKDYASGQNLMNRMPLYMKPRKLLSFEDVSFAMSNHFEDTPLEFDSDVGAGVYNTPYRARPLTWKYKGKTYLNERAIATQQTGWSFIAEIKSNFPRDCSSILWFSVDDSSTSPRFPVYSCSTRVSDAYGGLGTQDGVAAPLLHFDLGKAFWVQVSGHICDTFMSVPYILKYIFRFRTW